MRQRFVFFIALSLMLGAVLAGCGGQPARPDTPTAAIPATATAAIPATTAVSSTATASPAATVTGATAAPTAQPATPPVTPLAATAAPTIEATVEPTAVADWAEVESISSEGYYQRGSPEAPILIRDYSDFL